MVVNTQRVAVEKDSRGQTGKILRENGQDLVIDLLWWQRERKKI